MNTGWNKNDSAVTMYVDRSNPKQAPDVYVGDALVQPSLNRITIDGKAIQVEPKVMHVLTCLLAEPGEVVSRDQLLETVWDETVAYDYMLNRAVSELRGIFGDDAQDPRVIETIRKTGYRVIAPVEVSPDAGDGQADAVEVRPSVRSKSASIQEDLETSFGAPWVLSRRTLMVGGIALVVAAGILLVFQGLRGQDGLPNATYEVLPLTSLDGREYDPALSPEGRQVAFSWDGGGDGDFDLYVTSVDGEAQLPLADTPDDERHPAWSPDGQQIAFVRSDEETSSIYVVSAMGGPARRLLDCQTADPRGLTWSSDGQWLAYADRSAPDAPFRIHLFSLADRQTRVLTSPPEGTLGDIMPTFSPHGTTLVFVRAVSEVVKDLYRLSAEGGTPTPITSDHRKVSGVTWTNDGNHLLYTSTRSGMYRVWSVPLGGGEPRLVHLGNEDVQALSAALRSPGIAFEDWTFRSAIRRLNLEGSAPRAVSASFNASTRWDSHPAYAPSGARIAFTSNRSGPPGIWVSRPDGADAVELVNMDGAFTDHPQWAPDGTRIAFDASPDGHADIYVIDARGGAAQRLTTDSADDRWPSWSADGRWVYFGSNRSGRWEVWALPAVGGAPIQITHHSGRKPVESPDGQWLYYTKPDVGGLWRRTRGSWNQADSSNREERVLASLAPQDRGNWTVTSAGIYFVRRPEGGPPHLAFYDLQNGTIIGLAPLDTRFEGQGLAVSPDGTELLYGQQNRPESDLHLARPMSPTR